MRRPPRALPVLFVLLIAASVPLAPGGLPSAWAQDGLAVVDVLASQVQTQAATLRRASEFDFNSTQAMVYDTMTRLDRLADACAPFASLAILIPDMRVTAASMGQASTLGSLIYVEGDAATLQDQIAVLRVQVQNLRAAP